MCRQLDLAMRDLPHAGADAHRLPDLIAEGNFAGALSPAVNVVASLTMLGALITGMWSCGAGSTGAGHVNCRRLQLPEVNARTDDPQLLAYGCDFCADECSLDSRAPRRRVRAVC